MTAADGQPVAAVPSLRNRVLRHVIVPLIVTWLCATAALLVVASDFARQTFDRRLLDTAYSLADKLEHGEDGQVTLDVTDDVLSTLLHEQSETVYFSILAADGRALAGASFSEARLPAMLVAYQYQNLEHDGRKLRAVVLRLQAGVDDSGYVLVAHTTERRRQLVQRLLWFGSLPALLMVFPLAIWLWDRIERDLQPLALLQDGLLQRDVMDLSPMRVETGSREVARVARAVNDLMTRLERSMAAQREFAGNVAHELRTPLAGVRALAEFGLASQDEQVQREQLRQIILSTERASRLVNQLLDLAMLDENQVSLQVVPVDLAELTRVTVLRHLDKADALNVDLGARGLDENEAMGCVAMTDTSLVTGLLDNLIDNAMRYGGSTVTVVLEANAASCTLAVEDNGPGIPPETRSAMMRRWQQGDAGEQLGEGAGLGLFLVARYARLLGSSLRLDAVECGGGLRASVQLPRANVVWHS